jgi:hypothetical protein
VSGWGERGDREAVRFERRPWRTAGWWFATALVIVLVLGAGFGLVAWISDWGGEAARITNPDNVREQNTAILDAWESLQATAGNVCSVRNAVRGDASPTLVEDPAFAFEATYRRIKATYDRRMSNLFEARAVRDLPLPSDLDGLPRRAPILEGVLRRTCP